LALTFVGGAGGEDVVTRLQGFAAWAGPVFCGGVLVVVLANEGVACAGLDEAAI